MMKELSMHIMDIVGNSTKIEAPKVEINVTEDLIKNQFKIEIIDNGCGMSEDFIKEIRNPFTTTRTTRKVGLGIPLFEQTCLSTNGYLDIKSELGVGTTITAVMEHDHMDRPPMGDIKNSLFVIVYSNQKTSIVYKHIYGDKEFILDTDEINAILDGLTYDNPDVCDWLNGFISEGIDELYS